MKYCYHTYGNCLRYPELSLGVVPSFFISIAIPISSIELHLAWTWHPNFLIRAPLGMERWQLSSVWLPGVCFVLWNDSYLVARYYRMPNLLDWAICARPSLPWSFSMLTCVCVCVCMSVFVCVWTHACTSVSVCLLLSLHHCHIML